MPDESASARELRDKINVLAPCENDAAKATAKGVARYLAAEAQIGWEKLWVADMEAPDYSLHIALMTSRFAAAHALLVLAEAAPEKADETARQIVDAWNDGQGVGEWTWEHLEPDARQIAALAKELATAVES